MIIAGKPTAKMFNCGDALATIPRPICIKSMTQRIGIAIKTAPRKIVLLQAIARDIFQLRAIFHQLELI